VAVLPSCKKTALFRKLRKSQAPSILSLRGSSVVVVVGKGADVVVVRVVVGWSSCGMSSRVIALSTQELSQCIRQVALAGGRPRSPELTRAWKTQSPSPSRSSALVRLGASLSMIQRALPSLCPMQLGS